MKWFRNKEMLQDILERNKNELEKYKNDKIVALLKDESNLIQDHLILLDENEKLKKVIEILKDKTCIGVGINNDNKPFVYSDTGGYSITQQEYDLIKEVLGND